MLVDNCYQDSDWLRDKQSQKSHFHQTERWAIGFSFLLTCDWSEINIKDLLFVEIETMLILTHNSSIEIKANITEAVIIDCKNCDQPNGEHHDKFCFSSYFLLPC